MKIVSTLLFAVTAGAVGCSPHFEQEQSLTREFARNLKTCNYQPTVTVKWDTLKLQDVVYELQ